MESIKSTKTVVSVTERNQISRYILLDSDLSEMFINKPMYKADFQQYSKLD